MTEIAYRRAGALRGTDDQGRRPLDLTPPQKLMIFVLSMSMFGLSNILLEIIPDLTIGPFDLSVSYFVFVPLTLAALLSPFWVALGAPLGEIIFTDLLMGDFSGLAEVEGFLQMFLAIFIAGSVIRNPRNRAQIAVGAVLVVFIDKLLSAAVDLTKVWVGVEDAEYVEGLPESMLVLEGVGFGIDIIISGVLFGVLPALWLVPALHGRIEPLLGMRPRVPGEPIPGQAAASGWFVGAALMLSLASFFFAFLEAWDVSIGAFEPEYLEQYGTWFLWISVAAIVVLLGASILLFRRAQARPVAPAEPDRAAAEEEHVG
ncbi:cell division protein FtsQ [Nesterenkonia sp.]|uniref:cell division protein FtsQ n=1 Tax=Nesterenkonia sp. TaxID=704201 RepID=UPI00260BB334|nr:cell division protein FtsQ [Nesterenkonia sp.]